MENELPIKDKLALDRTKLANERTFLAYFRTSVVFLSSGFAILKLDVLSELFEIGVALTALGPLIAIIGIVRFLRVRSKMNNYFN